MEDLNSLKHRLLSNVIELFVYTIKTIVRQSVTLYIIMLGGKGGPAVLTCSMCTLYSIIKNN